MIAIRQATLVDARRLLLTGTEPFDQNSFVTALFESFAKKPVKSRSGRHRRLENNPKIPHGILCRYYMEI